MQTLYSVIVADCYCFRLIKLTDISSVSIDYTEQVSFRSFKEKEWSIALIGVGNIVYVKSTAKTSTID